MAWGRKKSRNNHTGKNKKTSRRRILFRRRVYSAGYKAGFGDALSLYGK